MRIRRKRWIGAGVFCVVLIGLIGWWAYRYHGPARPVEIYRGVVYGCERPPATGELSGLVHWARADLNEPGVSLFLTPTDPSAGAGYPYKLAYTSAQVDEYGLAAGVNGMLFDSESTVVRLPGDRARSVETGVADHVVNHVDPNSYLLWWDDRNDAHLEASKPPSAAALNGARWGISGQTGTLVDGTVSPWAGRAVDHRTIVAADPAGKRVWIACFDHASERAAGQWAADHGATIGVTVDGGTSTAMAIGKNAKGVRAGTVTGDWRPVATVFGFKAPVVR